MIKKRTKKEEKIKEMYLETNNVSGVMRKFKLSRDKVLEILHSYNIDTSTSAKNIQRREGIEELFNDGATLKEIGQKYNISQQRVSQILYSMGIEVKAERTKSGWKFFAERYEEERKKLYEGYHAKSLKHSKTLNKLKNCKTTLASKDKVIEKLKEENKLLKSGVYAIEEVAKLKRRVQNLQNQVTYYKNILKNLK